MLENNGIVTQEIAEAIICNSDPESAAKRLVIKRTEELEKYKEDLRKEVALTRLLIEALNLPKGTAGRRVADAILAELYERFPEAAASPIARRPAPSE
jgi:hypothetical protein